MSLKHQKKNSKHGNDLFILISKSIEAHIPEKLEKDLILLNNTISKVNGKSSVFKYSILGGIGSLVLSIILLGASEYFTQKWYAESIKTKEEIRKELLKGFENKGKGIYDVKSYEKLQYNTDLVNKWIEKYPNCG